MLKPKPAQIYLIWGCGRYFVIALDKLLKVSKSRLKILLSFSKPMILDTSVFSKDYRGISCILSYRTTPFSSSPLPSTLFSLCLRSRHQRPSSAPRTSPPSPSRMRSVNRNHNHHSSSSSSGRKSTSSASSNSLPFLDSSRGVPSRQEYGAFKDFGYYDK